MTRAGDTMEDEMPFLPLKDHTAHGGERKDCRLSMLRKGCTSELVGGVAVRGSFRKGVTLGTHRYSAGT